MKSIDQQALLEELVSIVGAVRDSRELSLLLEGLLTPQEIREIVFRWRLMNRLLDGAPQREIAQELGVSLGKISRGSRLLQYGPADFRGLVERLREELGSARKQ